MGKGRRLQVEGRNVGSSVSLFTMPLTDSKKTLLAAIDDQIAIVTRQMAGLAQKKKELQSKRREVWLIPERCTFPLCCRRHQARGYCKVHYRRLMMYGDPSGGGKCREVNRNPPETCTAPGCDRPHFSKGFCRNHYQQDYLRRRKAANRKNSCPSLP